MSALANYVKAITETFHREPIRSFEILSKLFYARLKYNIGPKQFFSFNLYNSGSASWPSYFPPDGTADPIMKLINQTGHGPKITLDKLLTAQMLSTAGISTAPICAVIGRDSNTHSLDGDWLLLNDQASLVQYLESDSCPTNLFSKPVGGFGGAGTFTAHRREMGWYVDQDVISVAELADRLLHDDEQYGRMLQPQLRNHSALKKLTAADGLSTVRIVTAVHGEDAQIVYASQKLISSGNLTDNFDGGHTGNFLAAVDISSGVLGRCYGKKPGDDYLLSHVIEHPDTGMTISGWRVPMWDEVKEMAKAAALEMKIQPVLGFDVAITNSGPMILEANNNWSFSIPQITHNVGGRVLLAKLLPTLDIPATDREAAQNLIACR